MDKRKSTIELIWFAYKQYYYKNKFTWQIWSYLILKILLGLIPLLTGFLLAYLIDSVINILNNNGDITQITYLIVIYVIALLFSNIVRNAYELVDTLIDIWIPYQDDDVYIGKFLQVEPQAYEDPEFVNKKSTLGWNSYKILGCLYKAVDSISLVIIALVSFFAIAQYNIFFVLLAMISVIPSSLVVVKFGSKVWNIWGSKGEEKIKYSSYRGILWDTQFETFQEIFLFGYGKYLLEKAKEINVWFTKKLENNDVRKQKWLTVSSVLRDLVFLLVIILSVDMILKGNITIGTLTFVISAYSTFNQNFSDLIMSFAYIKGNENILVTFYDFMNKKNLIESGNIKLPYVDTGLSIEFRNVWFKYPNTEKWIFKGLDFKVNSDEDIAIVGKNGAGKSTLVKLILRIYDPQKGEIYINGVNIRDLDLKSYYSTVGVLAQSFNKLSITAKDNILVGNVDNTSDLRIEDAARLADVHETIQNLPQGYKTFLTREIKNGINLSGGQWQKVAIARAFYRKSKLLILDEPTSSVDAVSEEKIFDNIRSNAKKQTTLIVSHRFSTIKKAKRIVIIEKGKIIEDGDHDSLMKEKGVYASMYGKKS